jgi:hypothetical protein
VNQVLQAPADETLEDERLAKAQRSINLPEVQDMLKRLASYNLGIYMPHIHDQEGAFQAMPDDVVQVEDDLTVSFKTEEELLQLPRMVPVAWKWVENGPKIGATCGTWCLPSTENGKPIHKKPHRQGY